MAKEEVKTVKGLVIEVLPDRMFRVRLEDGQMMTAHISGRLRKEYIRILTGDHVVVELSPPNWNRGRITSRLLD